MSKQIEHVQLMDCGDQDLELTVGVLLSKTGDSNKFIREDACVSLEAMVYGVSQARALSALIACGVG